MLDLCHLNHGQNSDCDVSKFKTFYKTIDKIVKMDGPGAQERRHAIGEDIERTTQILYSSEFDSSEQVRNLFKFDHCQLPYISLSNVCSSEVYEGTKKYLVNQGVEEGKDYHVPSIMTVCLASY